MKTFINTLENENLKIEIIEYEKSSDDCDIAIAPTQPVFK